jgi:hypothetical protein
MIINMKDSETGTMFKEAHFCCCLQNGSLSTGPLNPAHGLVDGHRCHDSERTRLDEQAKASQYGVGRKHSWELEIDRRQWQRL